MLYARFNVGFLPYLLEIWQWLGSISVGESAWWDESPLDKKFFISLFNFQDRLFTFFTDSARNTCVKKDKTYWLMQKCQVFISKKKTYDSSFKNGLYWKQLMGQSLNNYEGKCLGDVILTTGISTRMFLFWQDMSQMKLKVNLC